MTDNLNEYIYIYIYIYINKLVHDTQSAQHVQSKEHNSYIFLSLGLESSIS